MGVLGSLQKSLGGRGICREPNPGVGKIGLTGEHSGLARAPCDVAAAQNHSVTVLKQDLQVGMSTVIAHVHASGVPVHRVSFFKPALLRGVN